MRTSWSSETLGKQFLGRGIELEMVLISKRRTLCDLPVFTAATQVRCRSLALLGD